MASKRSKSAAKTAEYTWQSSGEPDELDLAGRVAHDVLTERSDLLPSVEMIMTAGLGSDGTLRAISLFRDSLATIGDVHRDPRVAIERCRGVADESGPTPPSDRTA